MAKADINLELNTHYNGDGINKFKQGVKQSEQVVKKATSAAGQLSNALGGLNNSAGKAASAVSGLMGAFTSGGVWGVAVAGATLLVNKLIDGFQKAKAEAKSVGDTLARSLSTAFDKFKQLKLNDIKINDVSGIASRRVNEQAVRDANIQNKINNIKINGINQRAALTSTFNQRRNKANEDFQISLLTTKDNYYGQKEDNAKYIAAEEKNKATYESMYEKAQNKIKQISKNKDVAEVIQLQQQMDDIVYIQANLKSTDKAKRNKAQEIQRKMLAQGLYAITGENVFVNNNREYGSQTAGDLNNDDTTKFRKGIKRAQTTQYVGNVISKIGGFDVEVTGSVGAKNILYSFKEAADLEERAKIAKSLSHTGLSSKGDAGWRMLYNWLTNNGKAVKLNAVKAGYGNVAGGLAITDAGLGIKYLGARNERKLAKEARLLFDSPDKYFEVLSKKLEEKTKDNKAYEEYKKLYSEGKAASEKIIESDKKIAELKDKRKVIESNINKTSSEYNLIYTEANQKLKDELAKIDKEENAYNLTQAVKAADVTKQQALFALANSSAKTKSERDAELIRLDLQYNSKYTYYKNKSDERNAALNYASSLNGYQYGLAEDSAKQKETSKKIEIAREQAVADAMLKHKATAAEINAQNAIVKQRKEELEILKKQNADMLKQMQMRHKTEQDALAKKLKAENDEEAKKLADDLNKKRADFSKNAIGNWLDKTSSARGNWGRNPDIDKGTSFNDWANANKEKQRQNEKKMFQDIRNVANNQQQIEMLEKRIFGDALRGVKRNENGDIIEGNIKGANKNDLELLQQRYQFRSDNMVGFDNMNEEQKKVAEKLFRGKKLTKKEKKELERMATFNEQQAIQEEKENRENVKKCTKYLEKLANTIDKNLLTL